MTPEITLLLGSIIGGTGALLSYWAGWRARGDVMRIRGGVVGSRRSTACGGGEITRAQWEAMGTRLTEGSNPFVSEFQQQINDALDGYRSINYPDPSPDRRPTNPYSGEQITLTEGRTQRGNGNGGPTTPKPEITPRRRGSNPPPPATKPQFPPARIISPDGTTIGYRPIPSRPGANPPPSEP
jgi:hypothetical protein